jgi:serine/threonine-protein kinase
MLDPVLARGLAKQPEDRFKRCSDFARAFTAQIAPAQRSPRRTLSRFALAAIVVLASIGALVSLLRPSPHGRAANSATITPAIAPATTTTTATTTTASAAVTTKTTAAAAPKTTATTAALSNPPDATFERMRDFVTSYYADLPARPMDAWAKLDANYQNKNGRSDYLGFWATIQSVTVVSVVPRDATSVVAELRYMLLDGTFSTERRWLQVVLTNGAMLIDDSGNV